MKLILIYFILQSALFSFEFYYSYEKKIELTPLHKKQRNVDNIIYYRKNNGSIVGITNDILVEFDTFNQNILDKYNLIIKKKIHKSLYLITIDNQLNTLDIANQLSNEKDIKYAYPDFKRKRILR